MSYAVPSPEPMPALYGKAKQEMEAPASCLVSNSFAVPGNPRLMKSGSFPDGRKTELSYEMKQPDAVPDENAEAP